MRAAGRVLGIARVTYWLLAALLLCGSGWFLNIAIYNWFAADFHNQYSHAYASRGNVFFLAALALFVAFVSVIVAGVRSAKNRRMAKT
jgi:uncharacterized membrane protein YidH (DUF202 family)